MWVDEEGAIAAIVIGIIITIAAIKFYFHMKNLDYPLKEKSSIVISSKIDSANKVLESSLKDLGKNCG